MALGRSCAVAPGAQPTGLGGVFWKGFTAALVVQRGFFLVLCF